MPLILNSTVPLPHIESAASEQARKAADALIIEALSQESTTEIHPRIPPQPESRFSDLIEREHARLSAGESKINSIDLSRYEALDAPAKGDPEAWKATLQKAYTSVEYLRGREMNLGLLETYGKNAWLIGNNQLEDVLKPLELEVEAAKMELETIEQARGAAQSNTAGELQGLTEGWRKGVGRMIETQAAAERLRMEILERRRMGVS